MRTLLVTVGLLAPAMAVAQVYRWVDDEGVVHYSDRPAAGAERADLPELQSAEPPPDHPGGAEEGPAGSNAGRAPDFTLTQPAAESTFRDARGLVPVTAAVGAPLGPDQSLMYYLDGEPAIDAPTRETSIQLEGVARGEHTVSAALLRGGREIARTRSVTFFMHPPTALTPLTQTAPNQDDQQPAGSPSSPATNRTGGAPSAPRFNTGP